MPPGRMCFRQSFCAGQNCSLRAAQVRTVPGLHPSGAKQLSTQVESQPFVHPAGRQPYTKSRSQPVVHPSGCQPSTQMLASTTYIPPTQPAFAPFQAVQIQV